MIRYEEIQLDQQRSDKLRTLFASPEYALLKEVIGALATKEAVEFGNASMYKSEQAASKAENHLERARDLTTTLDILDQVEKDGAWSTLKLDQRR